MARLIRPAEVRDRDTVAIARWLLGKLLVLDGGGSATVAEAGGRGPRAFRLTEVEAYNGPDDRACHASRGRTPRTAVMFEPGGVWYVYLVYGMHEMLNLVTGPRDHPAAVLVRGVEGIVGPGRLTRRLGIDRRFNGQPAIRETKLWLEDDRFVPPPDEVRATPRIGVEYAGSPWVEKPWRFVWSPASAGRVR